MVLGVGLGGGVEVVQIQLIRDPSCAGGVHTDRWLVRRGKYPPH